MGFRMNFKEIKKNWDFQGALHGYDCKFGKVWKNFEKNI